MTTTTAPPRLAPTEAEIREAIDFHLEDADADIGRLIHEYVGPIAYVPPAERAERYSRQALWQDLRPSEAEALSELVESVYRDTEMRIHELIVEATVRAGLAFAEAYPDAPRAERER